MKLANVEILEIPPLDLNPEQFQRMARLVKALRSGEFTQTRNIMHRGECFCVLGLACHLLGPKGWLEFGGSGDSCIYEYVDPRGGDRETKHLYSIPSRYVEEYGWARAHGFNVLVNLIGQGDSGHHVNLTLSGLNDEGATFPQLADICEYAMTTGYPVK